MLPSKSFRRFAKSPEPFLRAVAKASLVEYRMTFSTCAGALCWMPHCLTGSGSTACLQTLSMPSRLARYCTVRSNASGPCFCCIRICCARPQSQPQFTFRCEGFVSWRGLQPFVSHRQTYSISSTSRCNAVYGSKAEVGFSLSLRIIETVQRQRQFACKMTNCMATCKSYRPVITQLDNAQVRTRNLVQTSKKRWLRSPVILTLHCVQCVCYNTLQPWCM